MAASRRRIWCILVVQRTQVSDTSDMGGPPKASFGDVYMVARWRAPVTRSDGSRWHSRERQGVDVDSGWTSGTNRPPGRLMAAGRDGLMTVEDARVHGQRAICHGRHRGDVGLVSGQAWLPPQRHGDEAWSHSEDLDGGRESDVLTHARTMTRATNQ